MPKQVAVVENYLRFIESLRREIIAGRQAIRRQQAVTYWKIGRHIHHYVLHGKDRAEYGEHLYERLEKDIHVSSDTLLRTVQFYREYPISDPGPKLSWSYYRNLLRIKDEFKREFIQQKVIRSFRAAASRPARPAFHVRFREGSWSDETFEKEGVNNNEFYSTNIKVNAHLERGRPLYGHQVP